MPLIHTVPPAHATGQVKDVYDQVTAAFGHIPNGMQIYSSSPELMTKQWQSIGYYMQHPNLSFALLALMRMLISQAGHCEYCIGFNEAMLINQAGFTPEQIAAVKRDPASAPLPEKDRAMLSFVLKAVHDSNSTTPSDISGLKQLGWTDSDILDGLNHGAYMLAADTLLNALKVDIDY